MALVVKNKNSTAARFSDGSGPVLEQWIRVSRATDSLPASTSEDLFNVEGGRVLVKAMIGEVTTVLGAGTTPDINIYVNSDAGTSNKVIASDVVVASDEVGTLYSVEGDTTALLESSSGVVTTAVGNGFVVSPGTIGWTTSETITGSIKWDLYFLPLDENAYVTATAL